MSKIVPVWFRCDYDVADAAAIQALQAGEATEQQQQRALAWIVNTAAATYEVAWDPDNERATSFEAGRRFVGLQIVKLLKINTAILRRDKT
jgi:hypothetical protein